MLTVLHLIAGPAAGRLLRGADELVISGPASPLDALACPLLNRLWRYRGHFDRFRLRTTKPLRARRRDTVGQPPVRSPSTRG